MIITQILLMQWAELRRSQDFQKAGSMADGSFLGVTEEFKGKMWLANHVRMKHTKEAVCNGCGATVENTQEAWDAHETEAHLAACLICSAEVERLEEMREHHRLKHGETGGQNNQSSL